MIFSDSVVGEEDCLHLSVFTRDLTPKALAPVLVWIHGGAFQVGSNTKDVWNPEFLLREDVIIVSINYRLGGFGIVITSRQIVAYRLTAVSIYFFFSFSTICF